MPKFFTSHENIKGNTIIIDSEDAAHITKVLRLGREDIITVCDGKGTDYIVKISEIESNRIICDVEDKKKCETESELEVTLYQGLPKGSKMDYIIQKTTELGIKRIVPVAMSRCVVKLENKKAEEKKQQRWQKIAAEAAKQSGRGIIPEVAMPVTLDRAIEELKSKDLAFAPYECEENNRIRDVLTSETDIKSAGFIIGPEGGFDLTEIEKIKESGIKPVTLGKRILRTETAGEAVLAMVMYEKGDINA